MRAQAPLEKYRYKPYPAYKDSGVAWLGEIPAHWSVCTLKRLGRMQAGAGITSQAIEPEGEYPVYGGNGVRGFTGAFTHDGDYPLVGRQGALCGCVNFASGRFWASEHAVVVAPARGIEAHWLARLLAAMSLNQYSQSAAQPGLAVETIAAIASPVPLPSEQRAIAAFLAQETARIDALVAKKERLVELLQEKRTALITRAVTKGLDPRVPMKDSGVEWLGDMPAHWGLVPSTWLFSEGKQRALDTDEQLSATQKYGVIPQAEFERLEGRQVAHAFMHLEQRKHVELDDFVMSMRSFEGGLERVRARGCVRSSYGVLRASTSVHVGFYAHLFKSSAYIQALRATSNFIRDGQDLNFTNFRLVRLPSVPLREQASISAFLDRETARIDALVTKVREAVDRLIELRTALISAAVTGKIDVREEAV